jgi:hypothetical protein
MKVVLFTNARDEPHLREWAAHHLLLGFDQIIIYDHLSTRPIAEDFRGFDARVRVIRCTMPPPIKMPLMKLAAKLAVSIGADWMLYLDADEFLVLNTAETVPAAVRGIRGVKTWLACMNAGAGSKVSQIAVNWLMYGTSGIKDALVFPRDLILDKFVASEEMLDQHVKCFVRPRAVVDAINPHFFVTGVGTAIGAVDGGPFVAPFHPAGTHVPYYKAKAYIAHYVFQSEASYRRRKLALPRDDNGGMRSAAGVEEDCAAIHGQFCTRANNQLARRLYADRVRAFLDTHGSAAA